MPTLESMAPNERLHDPVHVRWPGMLELKAYCTAASITTDLVEGVVEIVERALGEPITHAVRDTFPQPIQQDIAAEAQRAWRSTRRSLRLSNRLSSPNHVEITLDRRSRATAEPRKPAEYGHVCVKLRQAAPAFGTLADALPDIVALTKAHFARVDSCGSWEAQAAGAPWIFAFRFDETWLIKERLGWANFWSDDICHALGFPARFADALTPPCWRRCGDRGYLIRLSDAPFTFAEAEHAQRYLATTALMPTLPSARIEGTASA